MRFLPAAVLSVLAGCSKSSGTPTGDLLNPPPETGGLVIEMRATWRVTAVGVVDEFVPDPTAQPPYEPFGLLRPVVGDLITIDERGFTMGAGRPLLREAYATGGSEVGEYFNQTTGRVALYNGGSLHLRLALGAIEAHAMLGLVDFHLATFTAADTPLSGTYRVMVERES